MNSRSDFAVLLYSWFIIQKTGQVYARKGEKNFRYLKTKLSHEIQALHTWTIMG